MWDDHLYGQTVFMDPGKGDRMEMKPRESGIDIIGNVHWGTHFCQFYRSSRDLKDILVPYFRAGLEQNEFCLWIVSEPLTAHDASEALRGEVPDLDSRLENGQIEILFYDEWYAQGGRFDAQRVLSGWIHKLESALSRGYDGLRLSGNTFRLESRDWKDFTAYEKEVGDLIAQRRMIALCTYSLDKCGAAEVIDVVNNHQFALVKRAGAWELIENSRHKAAAAALRKSEDELRRANELLSATLNATHVLIACMDAEANFILVNRIYAQVDGKEPGFFIGKNHFDLYPNEENEAIFRRVVATGEPYYAHAKPFEYAEHPERGTGYWDWSMVPARDEQGRVKMVVLSLLDITARIEAQMALHESEKRYRSLFNGMSEGFALHEIICDKNGRPIDYRFTDVNPAFERLTGLKRENVIGKTIREVLPANDPSWVDIYGRVALTGEPVSFENRSSALGKDFEVHAYSPAPNRFATILMDITARKQAQDELLRHRERLEELVRERTAELEERNRKLAEEIAERKKAEEEKKTIEAQLIQTQKAEALGRFAGGIAHDLNNVLYPVIIYTEMLLEDTEPDTSRYELLTQTLAATHRQRDLIKKILSFSRQGEENFVPVRVSPLLEETVGFLRSSIPSTIEILLHSDARSDTILGDPVQIQQVIMNLCRNAADAMESQRGVIELKLSNVYLEPVHSQGQLPAGNHLRLTVSDNGTGMTREVIDRIFDPFFTTKGTGKGSGMGLSIVQGILKNHKGAITVKSEPGKGSAFTIDLPLYAGDRRKQDFRTGRARAGDRHREDRGKRVLLVDDEVLILSGLQRVLGRFGYRVDTAVDGRKALETFSESPGSFDLVITDQTMPGITGIELSRKIREVRPDIPVILCTGLDDTVDEQSMRSAGIRELLVKPTDMGELKSTVNRILKG